MTVEPYAANAKSTFFTSRCVQLNIGNGNAVSFLDAKPKVNSQSFSKAKFV